MKYFETQKIHWASFNPDQIYFMTNTLVKKFPSELNIVAKMNQGEIHNNYNEYGGVFVKLEDIRSSRPTARIYFKLPCGRASLVYLTSCHFDWDWSTTSNGNWQRTCKNPDTPRSDDKAYRFSLGGTTYNMEGDELQELVGVCLGVKSFIINRIVAGKALPKAA